MFEKQLNFLKLFDEAKQKKDQDETENIEDKIEDKVEDKVEEVQAEETSEETDLESTLEKPQLEVEEETKDQENYRAGAFIKLIPGIKLPDSELEILRARLLEEGANLKPEDFRPFAEEINKYNERYEEIGKIFRQSAPGKEKIRLYEKRVYPDILEEEKYLAASKLYMKYLKACNEKRKFEEAQKNAKKAKKGKGHKNLAKSQNVPDEKPTENNKQLENEPTPETKKLETEEPKENQSEESQSDDDYNKPDPYGDIYPYSRRFNKKK